MRKLAFASMMAVGLLGSTLVLADGSMSLNQFPHRVEPVLVRVNTQGKVTSASPAYALTPQLTRLLHANLGEMIRKPATDKQGKPVSSQFIMNLALQATPRGTGDYDVQFAYVSTAPVPPGSWYWVHLDGDRLALGSQDMFRHDRSPRMPVERYRDSYRPSYPANSRPTPTPAIQSPPHSTTNVSAPAVRTR